MARPQITLVVGVSGSGKSYCRCVRFLLEDWLPNYDGIHYSNFPLGLVSESTAHTSHYEGETFIDRIAQAALKMHGIPLEETKRRIQLIPRDEMKQWTKCGHGPWNYFSDKDLSGCHVAIDEIHNFCPSKSKPRHRDMWGEWLGELRHQGATAELITQNVGKLAKSIQDESDYRIRLKSSALERDPIFKIQLSDWYELAAAFTGRMPYIFIELEEHRESSQRWEVKDKRVFPVKYEYFDFYNSYEKPAKRGRAGTASLPQFKRRGRLGVFPWFFFRHPWAILSRVGILIAFIWFLTGGGGMIIGLIQRTAKQMFTAQRSGLHQPESSESSIVETAKLDESESRPSPGEASGGADQVSPGQPQLVYLDYEAAYFSDGRKLTLGDAIRIGPVLHTIKEIDYASRIVRLEPARTLRLPLPVTRASSDDAGVQSGPSRGPLGIGSFVR